MQVNMLEAKNQLSRLVKAAQAGEEVIIANHGVPAVRLQPLPPPAPTISLADELTELRNLMRSESVAELAVPTRQDRPNPFAGPGTDEHASG
jgi:prevent-host-death family protein